MKHLEWEDWIQLYPKTSAVVIGLVFLVVGMVIG